MTWPPLLLADPSPCLRWLVLRDIFHREPADAEMAELDPLRKTDPLVADILALQDSDGSWRPGTLATGRAGSSRIQMTAIALARLGYLGFDRTCRAVARGAKYLFAQQRADGSWPLGQDAALTDGSRELPPHERYSMIPLQTAFPLRGLAACGYATDPRAERAYEWLLAQRLPDGAWPSGMAAGVYGYVGGYRRLAHSRWGCRSNTTGALICFALHPERRTSEQARCALDLLLGRETREAHTLGYEVARLVGAEAPRGLFTFFARFDLALILDLCSRVGATRDDPRVADLLTFVLSLRGEYGLWQYPPRPQISRWLTCDLMRSISRMGENVDWVAMEPRTPFKPYPKQERRF
jgi:Squalene-hopene cyclase C-terminal domain